MRFLMLNWRDPENPMAGGAERVTEGYLAALAERGHEVYWFANAFEGCRSEGRVGRIRIFRGGRVGSSIMAARAWYRRQPGFDLVIDQHHGIPWMAPWWCRTHCVAYVHEILGPIWDAFYPWPLNWIGRMQERLAHWLYRRVPFFTASQHTREVLLKRGVREVTVIPYGVHTRALGELPLKRLEGPLRLVVVSRLAPNKRIDHAIRALKELAQRGVEAELCVIGSGVEEQKLKRLSEDLGVTDKVQFLGALVEEEKDEQLRQSHLLLHTSQREGWGLNVIEANAMGTPAVVYPVPGLVESTLHEETGLVSEQENPASLADSVIRLKDTPEGYQRFRIRAWERSKQYHWDKVLPQACDWLEAQACGNLSHSTAAIDH